MTGNVVEILTVPVSNVTIDDLRTLVRDRIARRHPTTIFPINVNVLMKSRSDVEFRNMLQSADLTPPDGMPVLWAASLLGSRLTERVPGWLAFEYLCADGHRAYFLGGEPGVAREAALRIGKKHPRTSVVGVSSPPLSFEEDAPENERIVKAINDSNADIVFVGLGAPKQEKWISRYRDMLHPPVLMAVGGSFDFYAGRTHPPPHLVGQVGLGWFWRLVQEPQRLWRRYLIEDMPFFLHVLSDRFSRNGSRQSDPSSTSS